ncbi:MAG: hypothetical protein AVDCRST_MAG59-625, partial [uncultured Thermomicrobiales bacterium]
WPKWGWRRSRSWPESRGHRLGAETWRPVLVGMTYDRLN